MSSIGSGLFSQLYRVSYSLHFLEKAARQERSDGLWTLFSTLAPQLKELPVRELDFGDWARPDRKLLPLW